MFHCIYINQGLLKLHWQFVWNHCLPIRCVKDGIGFGPRLQYRTLYCILDLTVEYSFGHLKFIRDINTYPGTELPCCLPFLTIDPSLLYPFRSSVFVKVLVSSGSCILTSTHNSREHSTTAGCQSHPFADYLLNGRVTVELCDQVQEGPRSTSSCMTRSTSSSLPSPNT